MAAAASVALEAFASAAAGGLGSVVSKVFTYPLDFLKVKLSVKTKEETAGLIISGVLKEHGVLGLYKGISPKLAKSFAQKFIYFCLSEALLQIRFRLSPVPVGALQELGLSLLADCKYCKHPPPHLDFQGCISEIACDYRWLRARRRPAGRPHNSGIFHSVSPLIHHCLVN